MEEKVISEDGYCCVNIDKQRTIEKDIDGTVYVHITFFKNPKSVWTMFCKHADNNQTLKLVSSTNPEDRIGQFWTEREYVTECGNDFRLLINNDYLEENINVELRFPFSRGAIHEFFLWNPVEPQLIGFLSRIAHIAKAETDVGETYTPGTLLGNYNN